MKKIVWSNRLNIGVRKIDDQHRMLVKLANNLLSAIQSDMGEDIIPDICRELSDYTEFHFRDEEMLMEDVEYPHLDDQRKEHHRLSTAVAKYMDRVEIGDMVAASELLEFLGEWLIDHMVYKDTQIGRYMREQQDQETR